MSRYDSRFLVLLLFMGISVACNVNKNSQKSLLLEISNDSNEFYISDYQVSDNTFKKSRQQGNYQALILDSDGNKLHEITFQKIEEADTANNHSEFSVSLPLNENLHRVAFYQLDGSSGHYQRPDEAVLTWTLPDSVREKYELDR